MHIFYLINVLKTLYFTYLMNLERRIVITGMGLVCPIGRSIDEFWNNLINGRSSIKDISKSREWINGYKIGVGSFFEDFTISPNLGLDERFTRRLCMFSQFSLDAASQAIINSGILEYDLDKTKERTGVVIGIGIGGVDEMEKQYQRYQRGGLDKVSPLLVPMVIPDAASGNIAIYYGFHANESPSVASACTSGASAIVEGISRIKLDDADIMVCGGVGNSLIPLVYAGFGNSGALSRNKDPENASRPFDKERDGFVMGDGAGILILEELGHAKKRKAKIYAELLGYGISSDAYHITDPNPNATYSSKAIAMAIRRSGINPEQIDYVNTHGTSTQKNDPIETLAIKLALGPHARNVSLNSTKSLIGHTFGAAAPLELIATIKTIETGIIHPTLGLKQPDLEQGCDLDYTPQESRERKVNYAISNSFAFFGHNVVLCVGRYVS